jgi:hypothetical protein
MPMEKNSCKVLVFLSAAVVHVEVLTSFFKCF